MFKGNLFHLHYFKNWLVIDLMTVRICVFFFLMKQSSV